MRLRETQARRAARAIVDEISLRGHRVVGELGRHLTEDEERELTNELRSRLEEALAAFEFTDMADVPLIDEVEAWAEEHRGHGFRRPRGQVIYVITGDVERSRFGWRHNSFPQVRRSSDGVVQPLALSDLRKMIDLGVQA